MKIGGNFSKSGIWLKPEHLLQVVTPLKVGLVQEVFKVNWLKVNSLGGGIYYVYQEKD